MLPVMPVWVVVVPELPDVVHATVTGGVNPVRVTVSTPSLWQGVVVTEKVVTCAFVVIAIAIKATK